MTNIAQLDEAFTNCAVGLLQDALTVAHAHAENPDLVAAIEHLTECRMIVTAASGQVTVTLTAPAAGGGMTQFFEFTAVQEVLQ